MNPGKYFIWKYKANNFDRVVFLNPLTTRSRRNIIGAIITAVFSLNGGALFSKSSSNINEIEITGATVGEYRIKVTEANISSWLISYEYKCSVTIVLGAETITDIFVIQLNPSRQIKGPSEEKPILENVNKDIGYQYYDTDDKTPYFWSGTEWT